LKIESTQTGSTEWVEENREMLSSRAVAYLNIDVSVVGPGFLPATTPQLDELLQQITKVVCASYRQLEITKYPRKIKEKYDSHIFLINSSFIIFSLLQCPNGNCFLSICEGSRS
jgi:hypothetical protein